MIRENIEKFIQAEYPETVAIDVWSETYKEGKGHCGLGEYKVRAYKPHGHVRTTGFGSAIEDKGVTCPVHGNTPRGYLATSLIICACPHCENIFEDGAIFYQKLPKEATNDRDKR